MDYSESLIFAKPSTRERRLAYTIATVLVGIVLAAAPFGRIQLPASIASVTLVYTAYVASAALTAWLLRHQFRSSGFVPLAILALAHAYGALVVLPYLLTFPGVFAPNGLLGAGPQTSMWLWVCAHAGFFGLAVAYAYAEKVFGRAHNDKPGAMRLVQGCAAAAVVTVVTVVTVTIVHSEKLPALINNDGTFTALFTQRVVPGLVLCYVLCFALIAAVTRLQTVTNLWIGVLIVSLAGETACGGLIAGERFSFGWYLSCAEGAIAALTFPIVLLRQLNNVLIQFAVSNATLAEESVHDHLTRLLNRRGFDGRFAEAFRLNRRKHTPIALLMVDIDHFKAYNDFYGHIRGDEALRAIGAAIAQTANRSHDSCCRIGGEEFAVVLPATDEEGARIVADRMRRAVAALRIAQAPGSGSAITVSIGIAATDRDPECDSSGLHARADIALYEAKRLGRDRATLYSGIAPARAARALLAS